MRRSTTIQQLETRAEYGAASTLLKQILHGDDLERGMLVELFGSQRAPIIGDIITRFRDLHSRDFGTPRAHNENASTEISDARSIVEQSLEFQSIQSRLLFGEAPDIDTIEAYYGSCADKVRDVLSLFIDNGLKRRCGISSTAHFNRVGAVVGVMKMDSPGSYHYRVIGVLHDALEDLVEVTGDERGRVYGIHRYQAFLDRYIPRELHQSLKLISNFFDLLLKDIKIRLQQEDHFPNKENLLRTIVSMYASEAIEIHPYLEKMHYILEDADLGEDIFTTAKWLCYRDLYISEMAMYSHGARDYRIFEIKAIDLSDNGHGLEALSLDSRVKNLIKQQVYANYGRRLESTWHGLNNRVDELQEDALVHAEHFIIKDFLEPQSSQDFVVSALLKLLSLKSVFFSNFRP